MACFGTVLTRIFAEGWLLEDPDWKYDIQPEILQGKNVADFIDPDIMEKLEALEREEEKLEAEGFYQSDDEEIVSRLHWQYLVGPANDIDNRARLC